MKKYACFISLLFVMPIASGQTKPIPKTRQESTIPTQKEIQDLMKEAQKELDNLDPSTKRMMDSLGIKIPSLNNIPQVTDAQLQVAFEEEGTVIPQKIKCNSNNLETGNTMGYRER